MLSTCSCVICALAWTWIHLPDNIKTSKRRTVSEPSRGIRDGSLCWARIIIWILAYTNFECLLVYGRLFFRFDPERVAVGFTAIYVVFGAWARTTAGIAKSALHAVKVEHYFCATYVVNIMSVFDIP